MTVLAGVDLAWSGRKPTGICVVRLEPSGARLERLECLPNAGAEDVADVLNALGPDVVAAIDAPLIVGPARRAEAELARAFGSRGVYAYAARQDFLDRHGITEGPKLGELLRASGWSLDGTNPDRPVDYAADESLLPAPIHEATDEYWEKVLAVNATGVFKSLRAELRQLVAQGEGGAIVNIGSIAALTGLNGNPAYSASKHAVTGITRNAALDYARFGIRVNSVNMAQTDTPMVFRANAFVQWARANRPAGGQIFKQMSVLQLVNPEHPGATVWEQAAPILFLLSPDASNLTGGIFATEGGWTAY